MHTSKLHRRFTCCAVELFWASWSRRFGRLLDSVPKAWPVLYVAKLTSYVRKIRVCAVKPYQQIYRGKVICKQLRRTIRDQAKLIDFWSFQKPSHLQRYTRRCLSKYQRSLLTIFCMTKLAQRTMKNRAQDPNRASLRPIFTESRIERIFFCAIKDNAGAVKASQESFFSNMFFARVNWFCALFL